MTGKVSVLMELLLFFFFNQKTDLGKLMANQYQASLDRVLAFESYGLRVVSH